MRIEKIIHRLETERAKFATEALDKPAGRDAYEFGRVVGLHAGLRRAIEVINSVLEDEAERTRNL